MAEIIKECFLVDLDTGDKLEFPSTPEEITDSAGAEWTDILVLGRSEPIRAWGSTNARKIGYTFQFQATEDVRGDVYNKVKWLQSLEYPTYAAGIAHRPPVLMLIMGSFMRFRCIARPAIDVRWQPPWELPTMFPMVAEVSMNLEAVSRIPLAATDVRRGLWTHG